MAITRSQTLFGRQMPSFDQAKPGYDRTVNSVVSDDLHPNTIQIAEVALTAAQVGTLRGSPVTLVAAPGAGYILEFVSATLILDYTAPAYTETADNLVVRYTDGSGTIVSDTIEMTSFIDATADKIIRAVPVKDALMTANAALVLHNSGDGEFGNSGGSAMRVKVAYRVHATGL